jgi:hypothetical protein
MRIYGHDACRRTCVLPFGGNPAGIAGLRQIVGDQLKSWGIPDLTDQAQLAVTELAANVVRHVGENTPAALVMDLDDNHLSLELHDTSATLPRLRRAAPDAESGRGLSLLAAISVDWGSVPTPTGKAVWCKLAPASASALPATSRRRIQRATAALDTYARECNGGPALPTLNRLLLRELATYLIADLLHALTAQGADPDETLDRAQTHFEAEANAAP